MAPIDPSPLDQEPHPAFGQEAEGRRPRSHRPQSLVLCFFGNLGLTEVQPPPVPSRIVVGLLGELGVNEAAARQTLARMVTKRLLRREVAGRNAYFGLTEETRLLLLSGQERIYAADPFAFGDGNWTLLAFSMPEKHRDLRHQLRARLLWAGLGPLRDGLWIGPGVVDVASLVKDLRLDSVNGEAPWAFTAQPMEPTQVDTLIRRVWDVEAIRAAHHAFLGRWSGPSSSSVGPMAALSLLLADWLRLLRSDPGLPKEHLGPGWPADLSIETYQRALRDLRPGADQEFAQAMAASRLTHAGEP